MKPIKFGLKMLVLSGSNHIYVYNLEPYTDKVENEDPVLSKTARVVKEFCSAPISPPSGYYVCTDRYYTSPQLAGELLGLDMILTGTVMVSRKINS
jgi:hypothetical protein